MNDLNVYQQKALDTRQRRSALYAKSRDAKKAMQLYFIDDAIARKWGTDHPRIVDYVEREGGHMIATEYAKSRFGELKKLKLT